MTVVIKSLQVGYNNVLTVFYKDIAARSILEDIPKHQANIRKLKANGFIILGYCRKSPGNEDDTTRTRLLQQMVDRLVQTSMVDKTFVSWCSKSNDLITARDIKAKSESLSQMNNVECDAQGKYCKLRLL